MHAIFSLSPVPDAAKPGQLLYPSLPQRTRSVENSHAHFHQSCRTRNEIALKTRFRRGPVCFVANAKQGVYPHKRSYGELESEEEERRVLYVAMTRAQNELFVSRSMDDGVLFYLENNPAEGEDYFLAQVSHHKK